MSRARAGVERILVGVCFLSMLVAGLGVFRDYGAAWDEFQQRKLGALTYNHVFRGDTLLKRFSDHTYGPAVEFPLYAAERAFMPNASPRSVLLMRHAVSFLIFVGGCWCFFLLMKRLLPWDWALAGSVVLFISPRLFADSFYNTKDIPFLAGVVLAMYTLMRLLDTPTATAALVHAFVTGFVIDIRIAGIFVAALTIAFLVIVNFDRKRIVHAIGILEIYAVAIIPVVILFWPAIWRRPGVGFGEAYLRMRHYPWGGAVLFGGVELDPEKLPWWYLPWWMIMTTPSVFMIGGVSGTIYAIASVVRRPLETIRAPSRVRRLVLLAWLLVPIAALLVMHGVIYDAWRHFFFVYPALIGLGLVGAHAVWERAGDFSANLCRAARTTLVAAVIAECVLTVSTMVRMHPFENVYFSAFMRDDRSTMRRSYDLDYWGLSMRQALEWIADHDDSAVITVGAEQGTTTARVNFAMLPDKIQRRLLIVEPGRGDPYTYRVTNFRFHPDDFHLTKVHSVIVDGMEIAAVYK